MNIKFGKIGVRLFYQSMMRANRKNHVDWPAPENYRGLFDVDALGDGIFSHQFDVYYAEEAVRKNMVLVDIHGGGYIANSRKNNFGLASVFVEQGYDVVMLDYPLNKTDGAQDIIDQIRVWAKQLAYLWAHAEELKLNRDAFFLTGDSAGGHFALLAAEMVSDPHVAAKVGVDLGGFTCKAVALNCPVYDLAKLIEESPLNSRGKTAMYGPAWKDAAAVSLISPRTYLDSLNMPVMVTSCKRDFIRPHSELLVSELEKLGKPHEFVFLDTDKKRVNHVHNVASISLEESRYVNRRMMEFFEQQQLTVEPTSGAEPQLTVEPAHGSGQPKFAAEPANGAEQQLTVEPANEEDIPVLLPIYDHARQFMRAHDNHTQWKGSYPAAEDLLADIEKGQLYVVKSGEEIAGAFALVPGDDPSYAYIENGAWISPEPYGTIHRIASSGKYHGIFDLAIRYSFDKIPHLRIDTHEDNSVMQHVIEKNGFQKCGIIYIADGTPRLAYEKVE